jgi:hypothetical protein
MIYQTWQAWSDVARPLRAMAGLTAPWLRLPLFGPLTPPWWPDVAAAYELIADICAVGQTVAAHDLCAGLRPSMRRHHVQVGAGHYGVFSGARWQTGVYPQLRHVIQTSA